MKIEWVNHASFVLNHSGIRLLCDPWIEGYVFDNSWSLVSPTRFSYQDFSRITHIWLSHEHPDHFYPPNLRKIAPEVRRNITVLFQPTKDKRVVKFCRNLGFNSVVELPSDWLQLSDDLRVFCQPAPGGDSWLAIQSNNRTVLNLNDCVYLSKSELRPVRDVVGKADVLITQFSYASWWGNENDAASWKRAAKETLDKVGREIAVLRPDHVILAASFVFFCHEENSYMNEYINRIDTAYEFINCIGAARPVVLYPGDQWAIGERVNSARALNRYAADYNRALADPIRVKTVPLDLDRLVRGGLSFIKTLRRMNSDILIRRVRPTTVYLTDHKLSLKLGAAGLKVIKPRRYVDHDIALSSEALLYCLRFPWGGETLMINGRFQVPENGDHHRFFRWFSIAQANSRATYYNRDYYEAKLIRKMKELLGA